MQPLQLRTIEIKPVDRSADATETPGPNKPDFATRVAQAEFGRAYVPPEHADFVDRSPGQVRAAQEEAWRS